MDNNLALAAALRALADAMVLSAANQAGVPSSIAPALPAVVDASAQKVQAGTSKAKRKVSAYNRRYKAAFRRIAPKYKLKSGKWKAGGFKRAVKEAHRIAGGKKR